jgi:hypothetical protein
VQEPQILHTFSTVKKKINFAKFKYSLVAAVAIVAFVVAVVVAAEFVAVAAFATVDSVVAAAVAELTLAVYFVVFLLHMAADSQGLTTYKKYEL